MNATRTALLVFAREAAREGKVFGFGRRADALAHAAVLRRTLDVARAACAETGATLVVAHDGPVPDVGAQRLAQEGGTFEARFVGAIEAAFALGHERVVVVGADIPGLGVEHLREAVRTRHNVLGPCFDGGFYLLGLAPCDVGLLHGLSFNTGHVLGELRRRLVACGRDCAMLETLADLDDAADAHAQYRCLAQVVFETTGVELSNQAFRAATPWRRRPAHDSRISDCVRVRGPPQPA